MVEGTEDRKMSVCIYAFITKAAPLVAPGIAVADKAKADADKAAADAKAKAEANPSDKSAADAAAAAKAAGDAAKATADAAAAAKAAADKAVKDDGSDPRAGNKKKVDKVDGGARVGAAAGGVGALLVVLASLLGVAVDV